MIKISSSCQEFEDIYWVINVRCKTNESMKNILIDDRSIIATDGFRLHLYKSSGAIADGLYEVVKETKREIIIERVQDSFTFTTLDAPIITEFPDWKNIIPENESMMRVGTIGGLIHKDNSK